jgi:hypothetical protein
MAALIVVICVAVVILWLIAALVLSRVVGRSFAGGRHQDESEGSGWLSAAHHEVQITSDASSVLP